MVLWGLAAGVVALLGAVLFLVLRPKSGEEPVVAPSPTITIPDTGSAIGGEDGVYEAPILAAEAGPGTVSFSWHYPQPVKGDTFHLQIAPKKSEVGKAKPIVLKTTLYTQKAAKGEELCATVLVSRSGISSPAAVVACETAL